jgi:LPS export ABC transporter protein LptC
MVLFAALIIWKADFKGVKLLGLAGLLPANVDMSLGDVSISETGGDGRTMTITAASAQYFKQDDYFILSEVRATIMSADNLYVVTAEKARYEPRRKVIVLTGQTRTADSLGRILTSQNLLLDLTTGHFASQDQFCLEDPQLSLSGAGFVYDTNAGMLNVNGRILLMISQDSSNDNSLF